MLGHSPKVLRLAHQLYNMQLMCVRHILHHLSLLHVSSQHLFSRGFSKEEVRAIQSWTLASDQSFYELSMRQRLHWIDLAIEVLEGNHGETKRDSKESST